MVLSFTNYPDLLITQFATLSPSLYIHPWYRYFWSVKQDVLLVQRKSIQYGPSNGGSTVTTFRVVVGFYHICITILYLVPPRTQYIMHPRPKYPGIICTLSYLVVYVVIVMWRMWKGFQVVYIQKHGQAAAAKTVHISYGSMHNESEINCHRHHTKLSHPVSQVYHSGSILGWECSKPLVSLCRW